MVDVPMKKYTEFYKYYMHEGSSEELVIPSDCVEDVKAIPESVVLKDRYDNFWLVKMEKIGNLWYFKDGWENVVRQYLLEWGDVLIFKYMGGGVFNVKIFGANACEKEPPRKTTEKKRPRSTIDKKPASNRCKSRAKMSKYNDKEDKDEDKDKDLLGQEENVEVDAQGEQPMEVGMDANETGHKRTRITDWFAKDIFMSGLATQPTNPYFVTRFRPCRQDELFIPDIIHKVFRLKLPGTIVLKDEGDRKFSLRRKVWKDGRTNYVGGWRDICIMNAMKPDDRCICEFIREEGKLCIHISIVRANGQQ